MTLERTDSLDRAYSKLRQEIEHAPIPDDVLPPRGAMEKSYAAGDLFLHDPADNGRTRGAIVWISAEPSWANMTELWAHHVWGESTRHVQILIDVCEYMIANGYGDTPFKYGRSNHPLTVIADNLPSVRLSADGKTASTTARRALADLRRL